MRRTAQACRFVVLGSVELLCCRKSMLDSGLLPRPRVPCALSTLCVMSVARGPEVEALLLTWPRT